MPGISGGLMALGGIGEALNKGFDSYRDEKRYQQEQKRFALKDAIESAKAGVQTTAPAGLLGASNPSPLPTDQPTASANTIDRASDGSAADLTPQPLAPRGVDSKVLGAAGDEADPARGLLNSPASTSTAPAQPQAAPAPLAAAAKPLQASQQAVEQRQIAPGVWETPSAALARTVKENQEREELSQYTPEGKAAKRQYANGLLSAAGMNVNIPEGLPSSEIETKGTLGDAIKGGLSAKGAQARMDNTNDKFDKRITNQNKTSAMRLSEKADVQNVARLEGASRMADIFKQIDSGEIKSNEAVKSLLVAEMQRLETGASNPAYEGQAAKEMNSSRQKLGEMVQYLSGKPQDSVPAPVLKQLRTMTRGLAGSYMDAVDSEYDRLKGGAIDDGQLDLYDRKYNALKNSYKKRIGFWSSDQPAKKSGGGLMEPNGPAKPKLTAAQRAQLMANPDIQKSLQQGGAGATPQQPAQ